MKQRWLLWEEAIGRIFYEEVYREGPDGGFPPKKLFETRQFKFQAEVPTGIFKDWLNRPCFEMLDFAIMFFCWYAFIETFEQSFQIPRDFLRRF